jgi:hypothetical protein
VPLYHGSCHCGGVTFTVDAEIQELTRCDCSLCARRGAATAAVPRSALTILSGEDVLRTYKWNTGRATQYFCSVCGIYPFHQKRMAPDQYGVNSGCLEDFDPKSVPVREVGGKDMTIRKEFISSARRGPIEES